MKTLQPLTALLLLFLPALVWASWEMWQNEANKPPVDESMLRVKPSLTTKPKPPAPERNAKGVVNEERIRIPCWKCEGLGKIVYEDGASYGAHICPVCMGKKGREFPSRQHVCLLCKGMGKVVKESSPQSGLSGRRRIIEAKTCPICLGEGVEDRYEQ